MLTRSKFFTHERGTYIAVYALALGYSNGIAPLIMGPINERQGWRWVFVSDRDPNSCPACSSPTNSSMSSTGARSSAPSLSSSFSFSWKRRTTIVFVQAPPQRTRHQTRSVSRTRKVGHTWKRHKVEAASRIRHLLNLEASETSQSLLRPRRNPCGKDWRSCDETTHAVQTSCSCG